MQPLLLGAGVVMALTALVHSVVGEILIFRQLRSGGIVPTEGGPPLRERHVRILWASWHLVSILMSDDTSRNVALGWHDDVRMANDYKLVDEFLKMEKPYDIKTAYTNEFLDKSIKMPPINPPKLY